MSDEVTTSTTGGESGSILGGDNPAPSSGPSGQTSGAMDTTGNAAEPKWEGPEWLGNMPDDLKESKTLGKFKDVENLARSYVNAERLIGQDKIPMPKTDEDFLAAMRKLGAPEKADDYKFDESIAPKDVRESIKAQLPWFKSIASEIGLTPKQAEKLVAAYSNNVAEALQAEAKNDEYAMATAQTELRKEWGADMERQVEIAKRAMGHYLSKPLQSRLIQAGFGNEPELIKLMASLGNARMEEIGIDRSGQAVTNVNSIKDEISKAQADPAYLDASHPNHGRAVKKVQAMFDQLINLQ